MSDASASSDRSPTASPAAPAAAETEKSAPTSDAKPAAAAPSSPQPRPKWPLRVLFAIGGAVLGAVVGMALQAAVSTTGVLGPDMEDLITEQAVNFQKLEAKLDAIRSTTDPAQIKIIAADLQTLLAQQETLTQRANEELRGARAEIDRLKEQALEASGTAGGADLWLKPGESVSVGQAGIVVSLINFSGQNAGTRTMRAVVNVAGESKTLGVGDHAQVKAGSETYKVIYKQTAARADGRVGFDVVKE